MTDGMPGSTMSDSLWNRRIREPKFAELIVLMRQKRRRRQRDCFMRHLDVRRVTKNGKSWTVETVTLQTDQEGALERRVSVHDFDAVVIASGHYHTPRVPDTPGLAKWKRRFPGRVQHSKSYRRPENAQDKNYLLVGASVSATDIARELSPYANKILQSQRNGKFDLPPSMLPDNAFRIEEVASYDEPRANTYASASLNPDEAIPATVTLKSGAKICDIHHVILCTGYYLTLPFLPQLTSDETPVEHADDAVLVTDGTQFHNLHKDIFFINDPTLAFVGVPFFTATFTLFEFQAMVVAKVLAGQAKLPSNDAMRSEYNARVESKGYGKSFHSLRDQEASYVNELMNWVNADLQEAGKDKLHGHTEKWHRARAEQLGRMKAFFANPITEKRFEATCI
ncbi:hypothetical protein J4E85_009851 [Alternaria conjuncta]|uniref:uncharacterized protein n=1 Tax=Alternaria conjuncta TaxID=181017 RepID=UPI002220E259|nr:uncharacterized protein J4E85_009851 [Alternaria conjuncta]KAI4917759.1 hypothetical protein J4E85_009851 [Alternaria conjuncta]